MNLERLQNPTLIYKNTRDWRDGMAVESALLFLQRVGFGSQWPTSGSS